MTKATYDIVSVLSGGLDSTVATAVAYQMLRPGSRMLCVSFNYGQKHWRELYAADAVAQFFDAQAFGTGVQHTVVNLPKWDLAGVSALTGAPDVPEGHYAEENMKVTVVPNRNAIMLAYAFGIAGSVGAGYVFAGMHAGDHPIYPDCRPEFIGAFQVMEQMAFGGVGKAPQLMTPFIHAPKSTVVYQGSVLGAPLHLTWSCYKGNEVHCGLCGTCVERRESFVLAGVQDPTEYAVGWEETQELLTRGG